MRFSIIIPVYNSEKTLIRCINSVLNQSYSNYEIIVINDGSKDNSLDLINSYHDSRIKVFSQENKGLSAARNLGIDLCSGDYILFLDSDDTINELLLENLNNCIKEEEIVRFQIQRIDEKNKKTEYCEESFNKLNGEQAFEKLVNFKYFEPACFYAYKKDYIKRNKYYFTEGKYHEDFGLIPLMIVNADSVSSIDYIGYNYYYLSDSITNNKEYNKVLKKAYDVLNFYKILINQSNNIFFKSFLANSVLIKANTLKFNDKIKYLKEIRKYKIFDNFLNNTFIRKIKKYFAKIMPLLYLKVIKWKK